MLNCNFLIMDGRCYYIILYIILYPVYILFPLLEFFFQNYKKKKERNVIRKGMLYFLLIHIYGSCVVLPCESRREESDFLLRKKEQNLSILDKKGP